MAKRGAAMPVLQTVFRSAADMSVRIRLTAAVTAAIAAGALAAGAPLALKALIDGLSSPGGERVRALELSGLYVGALAAGRLAEQVQTYAFATGDQRLQQRLNAAMFLQVLRLPMRFHLDQQAGGLMQTLNLGLQGARLILTHLAFSLLPLAVQLVLIALVVMHVFDQTLWATALAWIAAYCVVFSLGVRRLAAPTRAVSAAQVEASGVFADGLVNVEPVKAFGAERHLGDHYEGLLIQAEHRWRTFHARRLENGLAITLVFAASLGLVLMLGASALIDGRMTLGAFVLLNTYMLQVIRPLEMAGFAARDLAQGAIYLEKWAAVMREPAEACGGDRVGAAANDVAPTIRFDCVSFRYTPDREVVTDVSFAIPGGTVLAVVGQSGAGKSSLLRLLLRYYEPTSGCVLIDGAPLDAISLDALRSQIAVVAQDTVLFNTSLERNILLARPTAGADDLQRAIRAARLDDFVSRLPAGLTTVVGERGLKLSGGEKQRVAIARAVLKDAPILVLDEATSALDAETERAICGDMIEAARGRTTFIVTHRLAVAAHADQILVLNQGKVIERGAHIDLLEANGAYARLWRQQRPEVAA